MNAENREIEAKFTEIDTRKIKARLQELDAEDKGEDFLTETIFYDREGEWPSQNKFARIRTNRHGSRLTFKHDQGATLEGTIEFEFGIDSPTVAEKFLEALDLVASRRQEKKRHSFIYQGVQIELDTWPKIPTYLELEGPSEQSLREVARKLGLDWSKAVFGTAPRVIEGIYKIPVKQLKYFTFGRVE